MKKILIFTFIILLFVLFAGCSISPNADFSKDKKRVVFVSPQTNYPIWLQAKKGFDDAAKEFGFYGSWVGGGNCKIEDMLREIDICSAEDVDAVITCPLTPSEFTSEFKNLDHNSIPLITIAVDAENESLRTAYIGSNYDELGLKQAEALHSRVGDNMKIGVIMSGLKTQNQVIQVNALKKYIQNIPGAQIIDYEEDWSDPVIGINVFTKMLSEHPEINTIFATAGGAISSYNKILLEKHLQDSVTLIGMDIIQDNLDAIRSGGVYGVMSQDFYSMGYLGGKYAFEASNGAEVPATTYTKSELITKSNVNQVKVVEY